MSAAKGQEGLPELLWDLVVRMAAERVEAEKRAYAAGPPPVGVPDTGFVHAYLVGELSLLITGYVARFGILAGMTAVEATALTSQMRDGIAQAHKDAAAAATDRTINAKAHGA